MLMLGVQKCSPVRPALLNDRASLLIHVAIECHNSRSNDAALLIGVGNSDDDE